MLSTRLSSPQQLMAAICVNKPLRKEKEIIKVLNMKHMSTDELERKLKEKEMKLVRLLDEEGHLRSEHRELLNTLKQKQVLSREKMK